MTIDFLPQTPGMFKDIAAGIEVELRAHEDGHTVKITPVK